MKYKSDYKITVRGLYTRMKGRTCMNGLGTFAVSPNFASEADDSFDHIHRALES